MRCLTWLLPVVLGGCNWVFGLDSPGADDDVSVDAPGDADVTDGDTTDGDTTDGDLDGTPGPDAPNGSPVVEVVAGGNHTCVRRLGGAVRCWGLGVHGQLGMGNTSTIGDSEPASAGGDVDLGVAAVALAGGGDHTCALLEDTDVFCWGLAARGQLGHGNINNIGDDEVALAAGPVPIGASSQLIAAGAAHTCAVSQSSAVRCWGSGQDGRLGYGNVNDIGDTETPAAAGNVPMNGTFVAIDAGTSHTCALRNDGAVPCWGSGVGGKLGYASGDNVGDNETPGMVVSVGAPVTQIALGGDHTCALTNSGSVRCWGLNQFGQLGYGNTANIGDNEAPITAGDVDVGGAVVQLAAGGQHTCALLNNGAVRCWGLNDRGQLGYGHTNNVGDNEVPTIAGDLALGGVAVAITAGAAHTCALFATGQVMCWGSSANGQLGYGNQDNIGDNETPASAGFVPLD